MARLGCPDTLRLVPDSRSFVFVVSGRPRPAQTILIRDRKTIFPEIGMHHPSNGVLRVHSIFVEETGGARRVCDQTLEDAMPL